MGILGGTVFVAVCIGIQMTPGVYQDVKAEASPGDELIPRPIPVEVPSWTDRITDFFGNMREHGFPMFKYKWPILYWTDGFPLVWIIYSCYAMFHGGPWVPQAKHWWMAIAATLGPFSIARTHFYLTQTNEGFYEKTGNIVVVGDSWSVPGDDFQHCSKYPAGYSLWQYLVAKSLGTTVRPPKITFVGARAKEWVRYLKRMDLQAKKNDMVIIHFGGNDMKHGMATLALKFGWDWVKKKLSWTGSAHRQSTRQLSSTHFWTLKVGF